MDIQSKRDALDAASRRGDHRAARALAKEVLAESECTAEARTHAQRILRDTRTDPFIFAAGALGLGLLVWLVYKYSP